MSKINKYKFFKGDIDGFKSWLDTLDKTSERYKDIYNSIVWIHPDIGDSSIETLSTKGWIYAHGVYFSSSADAMSVVDGKVYFNGVDADGNSKQYKLLNSTDIDNADNQEFKDGVVTGSLLTDYVDYRLQWTVEDPQPTEVG